MLGLMQDWPLTADTLIDRAARWHGQREVVSRNADGSIARTTYAEVHQRAKQVTNALRAAGIEQGDRVATLAFNGARHLEAMYGIMGMGAVWAVGEGAFGGQRESKKRVSHPLHFSA